MCLELILLKIWKFAICINIDRSIATRSWINLIIPTNFSTNVASFVRSDCKIICNLIISVSWGNA